MQKVSNIENIIIDAKYYKILLEFLNKKTGLNFEYYRQNFIEKRIKARMIRVNCTTLKQYHNYLNLYEEEIWKFLKGFTINYTFFFRDYDVFETLQEIFLDGLNVNRGSIHSYIRPSPQKIAKFRSKRNYARNQDKIQKGSSKPEKSYIDIFIFLDHLSIYQKLKKPRNEKKYYQNLVLSLCYRGRTLFHSYDP